MAILKGDIDGKYKVSAYIEYEIKNTDIIQYSVTISAREIKSV